MATTSIPSFDHLQPTARRDGRELRGGTLMEAEIRRNGQMKYQRTTRLAERDNEEIVMPDGEIVHRSR